MSDPSETRSRPSLVPEDGDASVSGGLATAEEALHEAIALWQTNPGDSASRDQANECLWAVVGEWARAQAELDARVTDPRGAGLWRLTPRVRRVIDTGWWGEGLLADECDGEALELAVPLDATLTVETFSTALQSIYRGEIGVDRLEGEYAQRDDLRDRLHDARLELENALEAQRATVAEGLQSGTLHEAQEKFVEILPQVARMTALSRRGGLDAEDRRVQVKVLEAGRRLTQRVSSAFDIYEVRKRYEAQQSGLINQSIIIQDLEAQLDEGDEATLLLQADSCRAAAQAAVVQLRRQMGKLSRVPRSSPPPYLLEHAPRLRPAVLEERFREFIAACPRWRGIGVQEPAPRVRLLPGVGNATYDPDADVVLASLFPIEVRLTSIYGAFGAACLARDRTMRDSYARVRQLPLQDANGALSAFQRDMALWVPNDSRGRRSLDGPVAQWFSRQVKSS